MTLMTCETAFRLKAAGAANGAAVDLIFHATGESALGQVLVARSRNGVCAILIGDSRAALETDLAARFPAAVLIANAAIIRDDLAKVLRFIDEPATGLDLVLDLRGTPFQRRVWEALRDIPAGRTASYKELARGIGPRTSPRAVGAACAANPIALAIPCHRVTRSDGDLAGYRWGIERKRELIGKEAVA